MKKPIFTKIMDYKSKKSGTGSKGANLRVGKRQLSLSKHVRIKE